MTPTGLEGDAVKHDDARDLQRSPVSSGAESGALSASFVSDSASADAELAVIVDRWPTLPEDAKKEILAIVEAAVKRTE
jgi:hypothetical protein